jgi:hypothetical protein
VHDLRHSTLAFFTWKSSSLSSDAATHTLNAQVLRVKLLSPPLGRAWSRLLPTHLILAFSLRTLRLSELSLQTVASGRIAYFIKFYWKTVTLLHLHLVHSGWAVG